MAATLASAQGLQYRPFFGRQADLDYLLGRARASGLTAVVGRPQAGKTRLLKETRDRLVERGFIVGYAESTGEYPGVLLCALKDAYARASATDKLGVLAMKAREDPLGVVAAVPVATLEVVLPKPLQGDFDLALRRADEAGTSGLEPTRLTYEDAFGLVSLLATASDHPIVLFLDAWDKCSRVAGAIAPLRGFLDHSDAWPTCHLFLGVETDGPSGRDAQDCLVDLGGRSPLADVRELGRMDLREPVERQHLVDYLIDELPAARDIEPGLALELLDGHPGVLHRWLTMRPKTLNELEQLADDAQRYRYPELRELLARHCRSAPSSAGLLAALSILPQVNDEAVWRPLSLVLLEDLDTKAVRALQADGTLEVLDRLDGVPSYGPQTRHAAARRIWLSDDERALRKVARREIKRFIPELAEHVTDLGWDSWVFAAALAAILEQRADLELKGGLLVLCECAASLFPSWTGSDSHLLRSRTAGTAQDYPRAATLVGMALANAHSLAGRKGSRAGSDALLKELRELCARHPGDSSVREQLAVALVDSVSQACRQRDGARRDSLLKGLRALCAEHPGDAAVREQLAVALVNAVTRACREEDRACRQALLAELRELDAQHPGDATVREQLAVALVNAVARARQEGHGACRDALLEELRRLCVEHPGDAAVREQLGLALVDGVTQAFWRGDRTRRDSLLKELRALYAQHPQDGGVRARLAAALYNTVVHTHQRRDRACRSALLEELRALSREHPEDGTVRKRLTMALFNMPTLSSTRPAPRADARAS